MTWLSCFAFSQLLGVHRHTVIRAIARGDITPEGYLDSNGVLQPIFRPAQAITAARILTPAHTLNHIPPTIT